MEIGNIDVFIEAVTIASACNKVLRKQFCNVQNYRLLLWSDNFENLFHNACPSYEVKNVGRDRRLALQIHVVSATQLCSAYTIYGNSGQLGRAIY